MATIRINDLPRNGDLSRDEQDDSLRKKREVRDLQAVYDQ